MEKIKEFLKNNSKAIMKVVGGIVIITIAGVIVYKWRCGDFNLTGAVESVEETVEAVA